MAQPLFFLPDLRATAAEGIPLRKQVLKERGLADVFADVPYDQQPLYEQPGRGPGDKSGCILYYQTPSGAVPRRIGFYADEQSWTPVGDGSAVWLGVDTAEPPKPEEMARRKQYPGYWIELGDGREWRVPVIRRPDGSTELPTDMTWDAAGKLIEPIKAAYESFWQETEEVAKWFYGDGQGTFDRSRALALAIRALSINYRFGKSEQIALRLVDRETVFLVLAATVDRPAHDGDGDQKKSQAQTVPLGSVDSSQVTGQAVAT